VLRLAAAGLTNADIADRLFLSPHTIRAHLQRIYTKLDIANRAEAVRYAVDHGLV
jgi:DNA-binding CsgD family transcriptional regulator